MSRRGVALLVALVGFLALAGSSQASSPAEQQIQELFWAITWFALLVSVIVYGALFYFLWRYRQSASPPSDAGTEGEAAGHRKVEVVWTVFPIVILLLITVISIPVLLYTDSIPPADVTIRVTGERFVWRFRYEEPGVPEANWTETIGEAWFQRGVVVRFVITSNDVAHSFAVPQLGIKIDAIPHQTTETWTRVDVAGDYFNQCAEFCGVGHHGMRATIHVFEPQHGRRPFGPPPTPIPFTDVVLNALGSPPWSIDPRVIEATNGTTLRLRIWNNNSQDYTFRIDSPVDQETRVPAFRHAWLNTTLNVTVDTPVAYGPIQPGARENGLNGTLNITIAFLIELREWSLFPPRLERPTGSVTFLLRNLGVYAHNFTMGGVYDEVRWDPPILPGHSVVIGPFNLSEDASGTYWCAVPGHREQGMEAPYKIGAGGDPGQAAAELPLFEMAEITFAIGVPVTLAYVVRHARRRRDG